jgi:hypothetical protein
MDEGLIKSMLNDLDLLARDYNNYEYGLPIFNDDQLEKMVEIVKSYLTD